MNRLVWIGAALVVAVFLINRYSSPDPHAAACNADTTKSILVANLVTKKKTDGIAEIKKISNEDGTVNVPRMDKVEALKTADAINFMNSIDATLVNIRQIDYDEKSEIRRCVTDLQWSPKPNSSVFMIAYGWVLKNYPCTKLTYQVSKLLDQPSKVYVSWSCRANLDTE